MGAPWAPSYACLHLGMWEELEVYKLRSFDRFVRLCIRYIDDILVVWKGTETELEEFINELNGNTHDIRLTFGFDLVLIPFIDLRIMKKDGVLVTFTFRKPTAPKTLLLADSFHPRSLVKGNPMGQFLRIRSMV